MSKLETYAIGSSLLTYDLIEKILKDGSVITLSDEAKDKIRHCREYLDRKEKTSTPLSTVSLPVSVLFATERFPESSFPLFRKTSSKVIHAASELLSTRSW